MAKEEIPEAAREYFRKLASKAGTASANAMTPQERKRKARKAANARWTKAKKK